MEVAVDVGLEVCVVQIFLVDPERQEQDDEGLEEDEDLCEPGDALPDRCIVLFAARNLARSRGV